MEGSSTTGANEWKLGGLKHIQLNDLYCAGHWWSQLSTNSRSVNWDKVVIINILILVLDFRNWQMLSVQSDESWGIVCCLLLWAVFNIVAEDTDSPVCKQALLDGLESKDL